VPRYGKADVLLVANIPYFVGQNLVTVRKGFDSFRVDLYSYTLRKTMLAYAHIKQYRQTREM